MIRPARPEDRDVLAVLFNLLWPEASAAEHRAELAPILAGTPAGTLPLVIFVADAAGQGVVGFIEVGLRSHADGCDPAKPVGFLEGWFVSEDHRAAGIGSMLLSAAEDWARRRGCSEMASDTWIDSESSVKVHEALGFQVVDRCVHFRKPL